MIFDRQSWIPQCIDKRYQFQQEIDADDVGPKLGGYCMAASLNWLREVMRGGAWSTNQKELRQALDSLRNSILDMKRQQFVYHKHVQKINAKNAETRSVMNIVANVAKGYGDNDHKAEWTLVAEALEKREVKGVKVPDMDYEGEIIKAMDKAKAEENWSLMGSLMDSLNDVKEGIERMTKQNNEVVMKIHALDQISRMQGKRATGEGILTEQACARIAKQYGLVLRACAEGHVSTRAFGEEILSHMKMGGFFLFTMKADENSDTPEGSHACGGYYSGHPLVVVWKDILTVFDPNL